MSPFASRWIPLVTGALALLFAPDCTSKGLAEEPEDVTSAALDESDGAVLTAAVWTLSWDTEGVSFPAEGGFELETDLGYHLHIRKAWILSHSVSFGLCDPASATESESSFWGVFGVRSAHAHVEDTDPSTIETSWIEDLTSPHDVEVSTSFPAARYCRAHWLLARATDPTQGADGPPMENRSLYVQGTFDRGGRRRAFTIDTWWPHGALIDLSATMNPLEYEVARREGDARHAFVTVTRHLGTLFDDIDFETASQDEIDGRVIDHLAGDAAITIDLWAPGSK